MTIENGYITLEELRNYLTRKHTYTAATIGFTDTTSTIADTYKRLGRFQAARLIEVSGAANAGNNGVFEVVSVSNSAIVISGTLTLEAIGSSVTIKDVSDTEDDTEMERAISSACRAIENFCHRRFWKNTTDEERYYTPQYADVFFARDDIVELAELATDEDGDGVYERVWLETDYLLQPANAALDDKPYRKIILARNGRYSFPVAANALMLTGVFGWPAVPTQVTQACLIQASRWYERRNAIFGVIATTETRIATVKEALDPDVQLQLSSLVKAVV